MIRLVPAPKFEQDVGIDVPGAEAPAMAHFVFRAHEWKRVRSLLVLTRVIKANWMVRAWEQAKLCARARRIATVVDLLDELIVSWEGFDLPYSRGALRRLLSEYPGARMSIFTAYFTGLREARRKN